jgi:hypothetical protein
VRILDCEQGTPEWFSSRLAHPTASAFSRILSPTGKRSTQMEAYANELVAEWITGTPGGYEEGGGWQGSSHMERGTALEAEARAYYTLERGLDVVQVGHCLTDDGDAGCSPDGLVGDDGLVELKCPKPGTHIGYLLAGRLPTTYIPQVQGQLWVTGRAWCDFESYAPLLPPLLIRVPRDEEWISTFRDALNDFTALLDEKKARLRELGITPLHGDCHE